MNKLGTPLLILGFLIILVAFNMDVSVQSGYGRVNNIGLMADRSNYLLFGALSLVAGLILSLKNRRASQEESSADSAERKCPFCAELIKRDAKLCKHCKSEISPDETTSNASESPSKHKPSEIFGPLRSLVSKLPKRNLKYYAISILAAVVTLELTIDYIWVLTHTENRNEWVSNRSTAENILTIVLVITILFSKTTVKACTLIFGIGFLIAATFLFNLIVIQKETLSSTTAMYIYPTALTIGLIVSAILNIKQSKIST